MEQNLINSQDLQKMATDSPKKPTAFWKIYLIGIFISWIITPFFLNFHASGGISGPIPGAAALIPILGQLGFLIVIIASPVLLFVELFLFNFFVSLVFYFVKKQTGRYTSAFLVTFLCVLCSWFFFAHYSEYIINFLNIIA